MTASRIRRQCCFLVIVLFTTAAWPWGNEGHSAINRVAAENLPADVPGFLRNAADQLAFLSSEPDRWRESSELALKLSQEPDHFIDLERVEGMTLPADRYSFYRALEARRERTNDRSNELLPEKVGLQPYITMEVYGRLVVAFRQYRQALAGHRSPEFAERDAIFYAGWLGHYVGDCSESDAYYGSSQWMDRTEPERLHDIRHGTLENGRHFRCGQSHRIAVCQLDFTPAPPAERPVPGLPQLPASVAHAGRENLPTGKGWRLRWSGNACFARIHQTAARRRRGNVARPVVHGMARQCPAAYIDYYT